MRVCVKYIFAVIRVAFWVSPLGSLAHNLQRRCGLRPGGNAMMAAGFAVIAVLLVLVVGLAGERNVILNYIAPNGAKWTAIRVGNFSHIFVAPAQETRSISLVR
jgi:hypothetical protein